MASPPRPGAGRPRYSVVIGAYRSHTTLARCLDSLRRQTVRDFEIVIVDSSPDDAGADVVKRYPEARLIRPAGRLWPHEARNVAVAASHGERLLFTDPDCEADPGWLAAIDREFAAGHRIVGGPIACGPGPWGGRALYLAKFWRWLPGSKAGYRSDLPAANIAVDRELFDVVGGVPSGHMSGDTEFCLRILRLTGRPARFIPAAVTTHINEDHFEGAFGERFRRGRAFARFRVRQPGWSRLHTAALVFGWPLLVAGHAATKLILCTRQKQAGLFLSTWPALVALDTSWMLGQATAAWRALWPPAPGSDGDARSAVT